jgi:hypothetical protein
MEVTLDKILYNISHPEEVLAVTDMEEAIDYCTMFIYELEGQIADLDFVVDTKLECLVEKEGSVAAAETKVRLDDDYRLRKQKDRTLRALKSYRNNIKRKRDRIVPRY